MWHDGLTPSKPCMLIFFTPRVCVAVEGDVAPPAIAAESAAVSWSYDEEEEENVEVEPEADPRLLDPVLVGEDAAAPLDDDDRGYNKHEDNSTGRKSNRGSEERSEGRESRSGVGDGNGDRDRRDGPDTSTLCSLWGKISLAARVCSRRIASGTAWFGSNFLVGPCDEDGAVRERIVAISGQGPGPGPHARASVPSPAWPRGGSIVHSWMLPCVGLYGV